MDLRDKVCNAMEQYGTVGEGVVVALSGGADSVALLALLRDVVRGTGDAAGLYAVHVNHGLRAAAVDDEKFVRELCAKWEIPLRVFTEDVRGLAAREKIGLEEAGRRVRYAAFFRACDDWGAARIATGHNANDNAETVLMNLCRGTGLTGLCGIAPVRGRVIRPLLDVTRAEIEAYLMKERIPFITDESNAADDFTRNRVRHEILPILQDRVNSGAMVHINAVSKRLAADAACLDGLAQGHFSDLVSPACNQIRGISLDIPGLVALPDALATRVVRIALAHARQPAEKQGTVADSTDISARHIAAALDIAHGQSGREVHLPGGVVRRAFDRLEILPVSCALLPSAKPGRENCKRSLQFSLPCVTCPPITQYDTLPPGAIVRTRRPGDRILLPGAGGTTYTKKLKDYFIEKKIPRHQRDTIPLVAEGNLIIQIPKIPKTEATMNDFHNERIEPLISAEEISTRVQTLAEEINRDYGDKPIVLVGALTGGVIFLTDLSRKLGKNATLDFVRVASYGDGMESTRTVTMDCHPKLDLTDKHVLLVEDIVDTGHTLAYLKKYLQNLNTASVKVCALLDKPSRREVDVAAEYVGFSIPDAFVVGYGLDYAQRYRNLPYVGVLKFTE